MMAGPPGDPVPVILDTDIGTDIDDIWALAMLLRSPELDLKLVATVSGDTTYRAQLVAATLSAAGRDDVPIAIGPATKLPDGGPDVFRGQTQAGLAAGVDLDLHRGGVRRDGVEALVEAVMASEDQVTVIAIGPMTNLAAALALEPRIVEKAKVVAMLGSIHAGFKDAPDPELEYNVIVDVDACQAVLAADWEVTITPLDTCGSVALEGDRYAAIRDSDDPLMRLVVGSFREWDGNLASAWEEIDSSFYYAGMSERESTVLFDTVAVYLAYDESLLSVETLPLMVADDGETRISPGAPEARLAMSWRQREDFLDHLTDRLLGRC
ncbi:MAG TPA: nucleoside hydrolase [Solirubrobacterales bacterium]|nr:nucleoside hydrolase [Solirubrobacterales bacterium]